VRTAHHHRAGAAYAEPPNPSAEAAAVSHPCRRRRSSHTVVRIEPPLTALRYRADANRQGYQSGRSGHRPRPTRHAWRRRPPTTRPSRGAPRRRWSWAHGRGPPRRARPRLRRPRRPRRRVGPREGEAAPPVDASAVAAAAASSVASGTAGAPTRSTTSFPKPTAAVAVLRGIRTTAGTAV
jgi:hypothetical protein